MKEHSEKNIIDLLNDIETRLPVADYTIDGVQIWPYIRLSIKNKVDSYYLTSITSTQKKESYAFFSRLKSLCLMGGDFVRKFDFSYFLGKKKLDILLFSFNGSHLHAGKHKVNRNIVDIVESPDLNAHVWQYTTLNDLHLEKGFPGVNIALLAGLVNEYYRLRITMSKGRCEEYAFINKINKILVEKGLPFQLESHKIKYEVKRIFFLSKLLAKLLERYDVSKVINVCYYGFVGMAVNLACKKLGIPSIEYQHGVQTRYHPMYSNWVNVPENGYAMLPSDFWVWGTHTYDVISHWTQQSRVHNVEVVGNAWLAYYQRRVFPLVTSPTPDIYRNDKIKILVSLQAFPEHYKSFITDCIKSSPDKWLWVLKEHPRCLMTDEQVQAEFGELLQRNKVYLERNLSLYELLNKCHFSSHITAYSTVAFECEYYGIPTVFFHENGIEGNRELIEQYPHFFAANNAIELLSGVEQSLSTQIAKPVYMSKQMLLTEKLAS